MFSKINSRRNIFSADEEAVNPAVLFYAVPLFQAAAGPCANNPETSNVGLPIGLPAAQDAES